MKSFWESRTLFSKRVLTAGGTSGIIFGESLPTFDEMKRIYIREAMKRAKNNQTKAAVKAGLDRLINRSTFIRYWKDREKKNIG